MNYFQFTIFMENIYHGCVAKVCIMSIFVVHVQGALLIIPHSVICDKKYVARKLVSIHIEEWCSYILRLAAHYKALLMLTDAPNLATRCEYVTNCAVCSQRRAAIPAPGGSAPDTSGGRHGAPTEGIRGGGAARRLTW